jgi:hypothetical protein
MTSDHPSPTTSDLPSPQPSADVDRLLAAADDEPVRIPEWMRQPQEEHPLTRSERVRLGWERHSGKVLGGTGGLLVLALFAVLGTIGHGVFERVRDVRDPAPEPVPTSAVGSPRDHFAGTPATTFAAGELGIVLPTATAQGPFTGAQVRAALEKVRQALIQSRLDTAMLVGDKEPFLALLAPDARRDLMPDFDNGVFLNYATRLDSYADWEPDIRVKGTLSVRATKDPDGIRVLEVTSRFAWVYPFDVVRKAPPGTGLVVIRDTVVWHVPHPQDVRASSRGLWLVSADATASNADCARLGDGFVTVEPWMEGYGRRATPGEDPDDVFDLDKPARATEQC